MELDKKYKDEVFSLQKEYLHKTVKGGRHFGIVESGKLLAAGSVRCYCGSWYLRGCVVKPEYRGRGYQKELIRERLDYLKNKGVKVVRSAVHVDNKRSLNNLIAAGFEFEKTKEFYEGGIFDVYIVNL